MVNFTQRIASGVGDIISEMVDTALVEYTKAEYERTRGSGEGEVAAKRIGAGYAGTACSRALAFRYHKFPKEERDGPVSAGELTRHGEAGHWTEKKTAEWMRLARFVIETHAKDNPNKQIGWYAARDLITGQARMAGEVDGVITGVPERLRGLIKLPCIWESKKATAKKWKKFSDDGIKSADLTYYGQVQLNMAYLGAEQTLFSMLNLDTMKYYWEMVSFDLQHAQRISDRALEVIQSDRPDQFIRLGKDEADFACKFCDFHRVCWHPSAQPAPAPAQEFKLPAPTPPAPTTPIWNPTWAVPCK